MRVHKCHLKTGIRPTPEFAKKGLATHAVNTRTKRGHGCLYCSTGAVLRTHPSFKTCGKNPFGFGYAIVDPNTPERVARDAQRIRRRGLVQLCTFSDAWAPEAQEHQLGRRCLKAILSQPDWTVRILTKNAAIRDGFDFIEENRDRILIGLSLTAALPKAGPVQIPEPNASSIQDRMLAVVEAASRGLRTYAMLCPLLPGIADSPRDIEQLVSLHLTATASQKFTYSVKRIPMSPIHGGRTGLRFADCMANKMPPIPTLGRRRTGSEMSKERAPLNR